MLRSLIGVTAEDADNPDPGLDYYFKACRKDDREAKAVIVPSAPWPMPVRSTPSRKPEAF
jgi:hypothetical protein